MYHLRKIKTWFLYVSFWSILHISNHSETNNTCLHCDFLVICHHFFNTFFQYWQRKSRGLELSVGPSNTKYVLGIKTKKKSFLYKQCLSATVLEIRTNASSYYIMPKYNRVTIILCNQISLLLLLINIYLIFCECPTTPFYQPKINR